MDNVTKCEQIPAKPGIDITTSSISLQVAALLNAFFSFCPRSASLCADKFHQIFTQKLKMHSELIKSAERKVLLWGSVREQNTKLPTTDMPEIRWCLYIKIPSCRLRAVVLQDAGQQLSEKHSLLTSECLHHCSSYTLAWAVFLTPGLSVLSMEL